MEFSWFGFVLWFDLKFGDVEVVVGDVNIGFDVHGGDRDLAGEDASHVGVLGVVGADKFAGFGGDEALLPDIAHGREGKEGGDFTFGYGVDDRGSRWGGLRFGPEFWGIPIDITSTNDVELIIAWAEARVADSDF